MANLGRARVLVGISVLLLVLASFAGCTRLRPSTRSADISETGEITQDMEPVPIYYDFEDILVPSELKVDTKRTFVHHAPEFKAGVLVLTGRVEMNSLVRFFEHNMAQDNWRLVTAFRSPRTMMLFNKPNRNCIVSITEKQFNTEVEIWVAPTRDLEEGTRLK